MLELGHIELNKFIVQILDLNYGIFIFLGMKIFIFIYVVITYYYLNKIVNNIIINIKIKKGLFLFMKCGTVFIFASSIILTLSNLLLIFTGYNVFQLIQSLS